MLMNELTIYMGMDYPAVVAVAVAAAVVAVAAAFVAVAAAVVSVEAVAAEEETAAAVRGAAGCFKWRSLTFSRTTTPFFGATPCVKMDFGMIICIIAGRHFYEPETSSTFIS